MVMNDTEKKCSLIARFHSDSLAEYQQKVRQNLPMYLNTAEKIRLRVTKGALTIIDRTIWHNRLERIPIGLIKESQVDSVSPKICYFVNETVMNRYQILAILCNNVNDSYKLVSSVQSRMIGISNYKSYSCWLAQEASDYIDCSQSKSGTVGSEFDSYSQRTESTSKIKKKSSSLPQRKAMNSTVITIIDTAERDAERPPERIKCCIDKNKSKTAEKVFTRTEEPHSISICSVHRKGNVSLSLQESDENMPQYSPLSISCACLGVKGHPESLRSNSMNEDSITENKPEITAQQRLTKKLGNSRRAEILPDKLNLLQQPYSDYQQDNKLVRKSEAGSTTIVEMKTPSREAMKSSITQYDSEDEKCSYQDNNQLQNNLNGIANIIIGEDKTSLSGCDDVFMEERNAIPTTPSSNNGLVFVNKQKLADNKQKINNRNEGFYDNVNVKSQKRQIILGEDNSKVQNIQIGNDKDDTDDSDEEYRLVLTGLSELTRNSSIPNVKEQRYPHQIAAAIAVQQSKTDLTGVTTPSTDRKTIVDERASINEFFPRTQSIISEMHFIPSNSDVKRVVRRKGQYQSIAEYEKMNNHQISDQNFSARQSLRSRSICSSMPSLYSKSTAETQTPKKSQKESPTMHKSILSVNEAGNGNQLQEVKIKYSNDTKSYSKNGQDSSVGGPYMQGSYISLSSIPNHVFLRRISSHMDKPKMAEESYKTESFYQKSIQIPSYQYVEDSICNNEFQSKHKQKFIEDWRRAEPNSFIMQQSKQPPNSAYQSPSLLKYYKPVSVQTHLQWNPVQSYGHHPKTENGFPIYQNLLKHHQIHEVRQERQMADSYWDSNPGFQRFFESIETYGPSAIKSTKKHVICSSSNQPDIVLESLTAEESLEDNSDDESSIRSSASAYWPPELKVESFSEDSEEAATSWKFHSPNVNANRKLRVIHAV